MSIQAVERKEEDLIVDLNCPIKRNSFARLCPHKTSDPCLGTEAAKEGSYARPKARSG